MPGSGPPAAGRLAHRAGTVSGRLSDDRVKNPRVTAPPRHLIEKIGAHKTGLKSRAGLRGEPATTVGLAAV